MISSPKNEPATQENYQEVGHRRRWWILGVLGLCLFMVTIDGTIINTALPSLAVELSASTSQLQWISESYSLLMAGLLLSSGALADRFGGRRILLTGIVIFGGASLFAAFSSTPLALIAARAVMGIGGALIMPTTLSTLRKIFPEEERVRAIGIWGATSSVGVAVGPLVGGWLLTHFWWGSIFLVNVPFALITIVACLALVPAEKSLQRVPIDAVGTILSTIGMISLAYVITEIPVQGWTNPLLLGILLLGLLALVGFVSWEQRTAHPMLDIKLFGNRQFNVANIANALSYFTLFGALFAMTQYLQLVLGYSPFLIGIALIPESLAVLVGSLAGAWLTKFFTRKTLLASGLALIAAGLVVLVFIQPQSGYLFLLGVMLLTMSGIGIVATAATDLLLGATTERQAGSGSAVSESSISIGGTFGIAILGSVLSVGYVSFLQGSQGLQGLPAQVRVQMLESLGTATKAAVSVGGAEGQRLLQLAQEAFTRGIASSALVGAVIAFAAACMVLLLLPARLARATRH